MARGLGALALLALVGLTLGPRVLPYRTFYVRSGSMRPALPVGSLAIYTRVRSDQLAVGDVIAFTRPGTHELVTHRIARFERSAAGTVIVTKGDANGVADPWRVPLGGRGWRVRYVVPYAGFVAAMFSAAFIRGILTSLLLMVAAGWLLVQLWRPRPAIA